MENCELQEPRYINREIAWIRFNERVLQEAYNSTHPLLERLKFLIIFTTNLDEFFMIRMSGLKEQVLQHAIELSIDGMTPNEQLHTLRSMLLPLLKSHEQCYLHEIMPALSKQGVKLLELSDLNESHKLDVIHLNLTIRVKLIELSDLNE